MVPYLPIRILELAYLSNVVEIELQQGKHNLTKIRSLGYLLANTIHAVGFAVFLQEDFQKLQERMEKC